MRVSFGDFTLDDESRQVLQRERDLRLGPKAFELLRLLLERRPKAVSKRDIHDAVWPDTFVSESTLSSLLAELRSALGDHAREPRFIRTVHAFGYAFCGRAVDVEARAPARSIPRRGARLRLYVDDREIALHEGENALGRGDEVVASFESPTVSRRHARILVAGGRALLEDLGSKNGTFVRAERVDSARALRDGDEIRLGRVRMTFRILPAATSTKSEAP